MFKIVLLQQWHTLSDPAAEEAATGCSFRRFCGLPLDMETPGRYAHDLAVARTTSTSSALSTKAS